MFQLRVFLPPLFFEDRHGKTPTESSRFDPFKKEPCWNPLKTKSSTWMVRQACWWFICLFLESPIQHNQELNCCKGRYSHRHALNRKNIMYVTRGSSWKKYQKNVQQLFPPPKTNIFTTTSLKFLQYYFHIIYINDHAYVQRYHVWLLLICSFSLQQVSNTFSISTYTLYTQ